MKQERERERGKGEDWGRETGDGEKVGGGWDGGRHMGCRLKGMRG